MATYYTPILTNAPGRALTFNNPLQQLDNAIVAANASLLQVLARAQVRSITEPGYAAVGDDATDNTTAIQALLDNIAAGGGGLAMVPEGIFRTGPLTVPSNVGIVGLGWQSVLKALTDSTGPILANSNVAAGNENIIIDNLAFDGNKDNQTCADADVYSLHAIHFSHIENVVISRVRVYETGSHGILAGRMKNVVIRDSIVSHAFKSGFAFGGTSAAGEEEHWVTVANCFSFLNGDPSDDTPAPASGGDGFVVDGLAASSGMLHYLRFIGCHAYENYDGFDIQEGAQFIEVLSCVSANNQWRGINLTRGGQADVDANYVKNTTISNCHINNNTRRGLLLQSVRKLVFKGNHVYDNGSASEGEGLRVEFSNDCVFEGNVIERNYSYGLLLVGSKHNTVVGNQFLDNDQGGLNADGLRLDDTSGVASTYNTIVGNEAYDTQGSPTQNYGIRTANNSDYNVVIGNVITPNATAGALFVGANNAVRDNVGYANENYGSGSVADGGTIAHGLPLAPTTVSVQGSVAGEMITITSIDATNITIAIKKHDNSAGTTQTVYWRAQKRV